ncbi:oxygen-dependent tRNA uridine(34) hydroxylase TrhO [Limnoglobus roseus]|uniref:tRNA uridine(34) hydroxylase n=1 Tax=Limnoglobus roseus TaxID=2598579 RepID=A0A5C1ANY7_9BACT|nr:RluA family pseudouridine synthase [Limnoglobus roseus]QEL18934.1 RluA family pseudouridine synthase [Limnoglobus roseus]
MPRITNIALYRFAPLADLKPLREHLTAVCRDGNLKGTILLSTEGVNLFVAGQRGDIDRLLTELEAVPGLENLQPKFSDSDDQPFTRMLVKIKKEIIPFGVPGIDPARDPAPKLSPRELKELLDAGRPVTLLDTRNQFEVELGTFKNALPIGIAHFREFPEAVGRLPEEMKRQPVVMFCTGGIRCEKAGPFMRREGFEHVYQLDGGILKYFEECGGDHYEGECFVFDKRVGLEASLEQSGKGLCFACQTPLTSDELADGRYVEGVSCLHCFRSSEEIHSREMAEHQTAIVRVTSPLPGSVPYENVRPISVPADMAGRPLLDFLGGILKHVPPEDWRTAIAAGRLLNANHDPVTADRVVREGELYFHRQPMASEPDVNADVHILHEDEAIIVLNKPAPLPVHPCGRFNKNSLQMILREVYAPQRPRPSHRLDANTTGVMVFTRTSQFAKLVQPQFERGTVEKHYLARVQGHPSEDVFTCDAPIRDLAGEVGSRGVDPENGLPARTDFCVRQRFADGTALLDVRPHTGRTNQIRVHLWHLDFPIVGDPMYLRGDRLGETQTLAVGDPPLCLHAARLTFTHPVTNERVSYEATAPSWAEENPTAEPMERPASA